MISFYFKNNIKTKKIIMSHDNSFHEELTEPEDLNISSGCDMSFEFCSDIDNGESFSLCSPKTKSSNLESSCVTPIPKSGSYSPPYKRVRALRLYDSPHTPKTILKTSSFTPSPRTSLFGNKPLTSCALNRKDDAPTANVNPFTPNAMLLSKKRTRSIRSPNVKIPKIALSCDNSDYEIEQPTKRVALKENNISRYSAEFVEIEIIGKGEFGSVYKCLNKLDGCIYAIKKSIKPVAGTSLEKNALNEVYAHAVLGRHQHVVGYYSAWAEDNHMIIQSEYCNGGTLAEQIAKEPLSAVELRTLLLHVTTGLKYIHSQGLIHLDIKPDNIFICKEKKKHVTNYDSTDDGFEDLDDTSEELTYKIGDLGHVTSLVSPQVEEGDCRYLPNEILQEDYSHLTKADIFSFGLTVLEAAGAGPLPKNGDSWHDLRRGELPTLPQKLSRDLIDLLKIMIHPDPTLRPSAVQILQNRALSPDDFKSKAELTRELNAAKLKNEILLKTIENVKMTSMRSSPLLIGKKFNRSFSSTTF